MKKYIIKIQNFSDIITNSSSELFVLKTDDSVDVIYKLIRDHVRSDTDCLNNNKDFSVKTIRDCFENSLIFGIYDQDAKHWHTMGNTWLSRRQLYDLYKSSLSEKIDDNDLIIEISQSCVNTIQEIIKNQLCAIEI